MAIFASNPCLLLYMIKSWLFYGTHSCDLITLNLFFKSEKLSYVFILCVHILHTVCVCKSIYVALQMCFLFVYPWYVYLETPSLASCNVKNKMCLCSCLELEIISMIWFTWAVICVLFLSLAVNDNWWIRLLFLLFGLVLLGQGFVIRVWSILSAPGVWTCSSTWSSKSMWRTVSVTGLYYIVIEAIIILFRPAITC